MRFKSSKFKVQSSKFLLPVVCYLLFVIYFTATFYSFPYAAIKDRVVAYVDNTAVTLSELEMKYADAAKITPNVTKEEVLNTMINRALIVREAKKIRLEAPSEDELLREYIDLRVRAFIRISEEQILDFYSKHIGDFKGQEFDAVREDVENYLTENELNQRLKTHINELREKTCVQIQLDKEVRK